MSVKKYLTQGIVALLALLPLVVFLGLVLSAMATVEPWSAAAEVAVFRASELLAVLWLAGAVLFGVRWALGATFGPYRLCLVSRGGEDHFAAQHPGGPS